MNKKYLDKVVDQLVYETDIDDMIVSPLFLPTTSYPFLLHNFSLWLSLPYVPTNFVISVTMIDGLTKEEVKYVWDEYKILIKKKINDNRI